MSENSCKDFRSFMFMCDNNCNIIIEAKNKKEAINAFEERFEKLFNLDWKIFQVTTKIDVNNDRIDYYL